MKRYLLVLAVMMLLGTLVNAAVISTDEELYSALSAGDFESETTLEPGRLYDLSEMPAWTEQTFESDMIFDGRGAVILLPENQPLFSANKGIIKNIRIGLTKNLCKDNNAGVFCISNSGEIAGCTVFGEMTVRVYSKNGSNAGGITSSNSGTVTDCQVLGITIGYSKTGMNSGGITGTNTGTITNCRADGIRVYADDEYGWAGGIASYNLKNGYIFHSEITNSAVQAANAAGIAAYNSRYKADGDSPIIGQCFVVDTRITGKLAAAFSVTNSSGIIRFSYAAGNFVYGSERGAGIAINNVSYAEGGQTYGSPLINYVFYSTEDSYSEAVRTGDAPKNSKGRSNNFFSGPDSISTMDFGGFLQFGPKYPVFLGQHYLKVKQGNLTLGNIAAVTSDGTVLHWDSSIIDEENTMSLNLAFSVNNGPYSKVIGTPILNGRESFTVHSYSANGDVLMINSRFSPSSYSVNIECSGSITNNNQLLLAGEVNKHLANLESLTESLYPAAAYSNYQKAINNAADACTINTTYSLAENHIKNMNRHAIYPPEGIKLDQSSAVLGTGNTLQLNAEITPEYAYCQDIIWTSSDTDVARVSSGGLVTAMGTGTAVITAETAEGGLTAECTITVADKKPAEGISLNRTKILYLKEGKTYTFVPTVTPDTAADKRVKWGMGNEALASLYKTSDTKAIVYGKAQGRTQIGVRSVANESLLAKCGIQVYKPITKAEISETAVTLTAGKTKTLSARISPADATYKDKIKWGSTKSKIASVDQNGKITAKSKGTCIVGFKTSEGGFKATCKVTVK